MSAGASEESSAATYQWSCVPSGPVKSTPASWSASSFRGEGSGTTFASAGSGTGWFRESNVVTSSKLRSFSRSPGAEKGGTPALEALR